MNLTDKQWNILAPIIPNKQRPDKRGRPRQDPRDVLNGILWILRTGAQWADLPERYPPYQTCHRRFQEWVKEGVLQDILEAMARDLEERGEIDLSECYIDAMFVIAKKGGLVLARPSGAKAARSWQYQTLLVLVSPSTLRLLARMKSNLYTKLSHLDTSRALQSGS